MYRSLMTRLQMLLILLTTLTAQAAAENQPTRSETIASVLRNPLPPEDISHSVGLRDITIQGPTYKCIVDAITGAIRAVQVLREGQIVVKLDAPADVTIDDYKLASERNTGKTEVVSHSAEKIVLKTEGTLKTFGQKPDLPYRLTHVFYNDGVVVSELTLRPQQEVPVNNAMTYRLQAQGRFTHYLHKELNQPGHASPCAPLPDAGKAVRFQTVTSCLQVFSTEAALAAFTDSGATHMARPGMDTAVVNVKQKDAGQVSATLTQHVVNVGPEGTPYVLKAGADHTFRFGISVAPNRHPHPRRRDLRMFIWVGDDKNPYPTDKEIMDAAQLGFTLFQMHRLGNPGEPRPPAEELDRVINTVHSAGMLFLWTANADLQYACAKGVKDLQAAGKWSLWQGFNYGGKYTARMDAYCNTLATCLASPNGLAEYRLECDGRMMEKYKVDGMYIDDNLPYGNCTLAKEHKHPRSPYDSLIELHDMNWSRRQLLRKTCPHAVLVDHCSTGFILPTICDFDVHLYGEGYGFSSLEAYRSIFGSVDNMYAQGSMFAGDSETSRCAASLAYNYDLLTGGGQYTYLDWRLYPKKFPYASGVSANEVLFVRTYNLAQYYFGIYESAVHDFAAFADAFSTSTPLTYAAVYHNRVWDDFLIPVANMAKDDKKTSIKITSPEKLGLSANAGYLLFDVNERTTAPVKDEMLAGALADISVPRQALRLLYLRELPGHAPCHLWGGKRIAETWNAEKQTLETLLLGPAGLEDVVFITPGNQGVREVKVDGKPSPFFFDPSRKLVHGRVTFAENPVVVEIGCSQDGKTALPEQAVTPDALAAERRRTP